MSRGRSYSLSGEEPLGLAGEFGPEVGGRRGGSVDDEIIGGGGGYNGCRRAASVDDDDSGSQLSSAARAAADTARFRLDRFDDTIDDLEERASDAFRRVHLPPQIVAALHDLENHDVVQAALDKMHRAYSYVEPVTGRILSRVGSLDETGSDVDFVIPPHMGGRSSSLARSPSLAARASPRFGSSVTSLDLINYHASRTPPLIRVEAPREGDPYHGLYYPAPDQISLLSASDSERQQYELVRPNIFYRNPPGPLPKHKKKRSFMVHQPASSAAAFTTLYNPYDYRSSSKSQRDEPSSCDCVNHECERDFRYDRLSEITDKNGCSHSEVDASRLRSGRRLLPRAPPPKQPQNRLQHLDSIEESTKCGGGRSKNSDSCGNKNQCNISSNDNKQYCEPQCSSGGVSDRTGCHPNSSSNRNEDRQQGKHLGSNHGGPIRRQPSKLLRQTSVDIEGLDSSEREPLLTQHKPKQPRLEQVKKLSEKEVKEDYLRDKLDSVVCINGKTYVIPQSSVQQKERTGDECYGGASQFFENSQSIDWQAVKAGTGNNQ